MAQVAVIGAGPAGLMAAEIVARAGHAVTVFDQMKSPARKFLMAGLGGLNLTHTGDLDTDFLPAYFHLPQQVTAAIRAFSPQDLMDFSTGLGEPTFVGSSGKIFPQSFKASPFLRAWLRRLDGLGVTLKVNHRWTDFSDAKLVFSADDGALFEFDWDATILALGGASWPRLGSDGHAVETLLAGCTKVRPFAPSNMGVTVNWSEYFCKYFAGAPLKSIRVRLGDHQLDGEALITDYGLEGSVIYAMSDRIRLALTKADAPVNIDISLRPQLSLDEIRVKLAAAQNRNRKDSTSSVLRKALKLSSVERALLHEAGPLPKQSDELAMRIHAIPLNVTGYQGLARAISSAGGLISNDLTEDLMIHRLPGMFAAGEMLDYDAPTGGYLLQAAFATGKLAGEGALRFLARGPQKPTYLPLLPITA